MPVIGMAPAMLSTGGFVCAICADLVLGVPAAVEAPILSKYFGKWVFLTWQTNVLCLLYSLLCAADAQYPSPTLDAYVTSPQHQHIDYCPPMLLLFTSAKSRLLRISVGGSWGSFRSISWSRSSSLWGTMASSTPPK